MTSQTSFALMQLVKTLKCAKTVLDIIEKIAGYVLNRDWKHLALLESGGEQ